jgi:hypothetical protein
MMKTLRWVKQSLRFSRSSFLSCTLTTWRQEPSTVTEGTYGFSEGRSFGPATCGQNSEEPILHFFCQILHLKTVAQCCRDPRPSGSRATLTQPVESWRTSFRVKRSRKVGCAERPNPSLKRSTNGRPPGPGLRYGVHFLSPGPGVLPLEPA